jgi:para-nitrobenzyl esterase
MSMSEPLPPGRAAGSRASPRTGLWKALALASFVLLTQCSDRAASTSDRETGSAGSSDRAPSPPVSRPTVTTLEGPVLGARDADTLVFRGLPYAAPPVGDRRWRAPQPPLVRSGTLDAEYFGLSCVQPPGLSTTNGGDPGRTGEDCLTLNIWTPSLAPSARLPVFVWIHGGAFIFGSGSLDIYNGASLASRGAVVITLNYRLGQLGFFAHPALERETPGGPVNFGLLDQIQALTWIQRNIAGFGGDPANVTIAGQSAGAQSVLALLTSPLSRGLFHKAIAQSSYAIPDITRAQASASGIAAARRAGLPGAAATSDDLRAIPADRLATMVGRPLSFSPVLARGDAVLPRSAQQVFADGQEAAVPLVIGSTSDDGSVVEGFGFAFGDLVRRLSAARLNLQLLYPNVSDDTELGRQAIRDVIFTMQARWAADRHARLAPTWRYYFDYTAVGLTLPAFKGASHGGDVVFTLDSHVALGSEAQFTAADRAVARQIGDYWFGFAKTGQPAAANAPLWPDHRSDRDSTMVFTATPSVERDFMRARLNTMMASTRLLERLMAR